MPDWIDTFLEYTAGANTPRPFVLWSAIAAVSAIVERRRFMVTDIGALYPNVYIMLVAKPGVGKTVAGNKARELLEQIDVNISPNNMTRASFNDELAKCTNTRLIEVNGRQRELKQTAMLVYAPEFGQMVPAYDADFVMHLTGIYDGGRYVESKRTKGVVELDNLYISMLACTTPSQLGDFLSEKAWEGGFMSRTIIINGQPLPYRSLFSGRNNRVKEDTLAATLVELGKKMQATGGLIDVSEEAIAAIDAWGYGGYEPVPTHPKLAGYLSRRMTHALKLCMISAASAGNAQVELSDWQRALGWLLEAEAMMEDALIAIASGTTDSQVIDETWSFVYKEYNRANAKRLNSPPGTQNLPAEVCISDMRLTALLARKVPAYTITTIKETMCNAGILVVQSDANGNKVYKPGTAPRRDQI